MGKIREFPCLSLKFQKIDPLADRGLSRLLRNGGPLRWLGRAGKFSSLGGTNQRGGNQEKEQGKTRTEATHGNHPTCSKGLIRVHPVSYDLPLRFQVSTRVYNAPMPFRGAGPSNGGPRRGGKTPPPDDTLEEAAYLKALGETQKSVSIKLVDGEIVQGWIEYYDK